MEAERRLADAVDLVRRMAEKSVHYISRKPFMTLFTHMTTLLVENGRIFEPVAVDYCKALRTLLSYPPHLEHLDRRSWRKLMGICWAGVLGDRIGQDEDFTEALDELDDDDASIQGNGTRRYTLSAYVTNEVVALIPVLLRSANAPLVQKPPKHGEEPEEPATGMDLLLKIYRYLSTEPAVVSLDILRSLNMVLGEMELNCREQFTAAASKLFPELVRIWTLKSKVDLGIREHVLIAMRTILPFISHPVPPESGGKEALVDSMSRLLDHLVKEAGSRAAIKPLELDTLRFSMNSQDRETRQPFQLMGLSAGSGFEASSALSWATLELLSDCCFQTYKIHSIPASSTTQTQRSRKRQRTESSLDQLVNLTLSGSNATRLFACQTLVFFLDKYWQGIDTEARDNIRQRLLDLLDDDHAELQSWSFIGLACLASVDDKTEENTRRMPVIPAALAARRSQLQSAWVRLWAHAIRKTSVGPISRSACHAAEVILKAGKVDLARCLRDIHLLLKNVDIQGPPSASEAACSFFVVCLEQVRADAGLYSANLEDKVLDWFAKSSAVESGNRIRVDQASPTTHLRLLASICNYKSVDIDISDSETLPDCPTVNRVLYESSTARLRTFILDGTMPPVSENTITEAGASTLPPAPDLDTLAFLDGRASRVCEALKATLEVTTSEWTQSDRTMLVAPPRLRKAIDLVVLVLLYQATIRANGHRPDTNCLVSAANLLGVVIPHLKSLAEQDVANQLLVWHGFAPLYACKPRQYEIWPVLVKPDQASGIRRDLLPVTRYATYYAEDTEGTSPRDAMLSIVWTTEEVRTQF